MCIFLIICWQSLMANYPVCRSKTLSWKTPQSSISLGLYQMDSKSCFNSLVLEVYILCQKIIWDLLKSNKTLVEEIELEWYIYSMPREQYHPSWIDIKIKIFWQLTDQGYTIFDWYTQIFKGDFWLIRLMLLVTHHNIQNNSFQDILIDIFMPTIVIYFILWLYNKCV
jgi:hypothetical protein